jgi:hypothetical protein
MVLAPGFGTGASTRSSRRTGDRADDAFGAGGRSRSGRPEQVAAWRDGTPYVAELGEDSAGTRWGLGGPITQAAWPGGAARRVTAQTGGTRMVGENVGNSGIAIFVARELQPVTCGLAVNNPVEKRR